jgi:hypothetical protein
MNEENLQTSEKETEQEPIIPEEETLEDDGGDGESDNEPKGEPSQPPVEDLKKKLSASARENSILREQIKNLNSKIGYFTKEEAPTDAELKNLYPNWDEMGPLEKELASKNVILERRLNKVSSEVSRIAEERKWNEELDNFFERNEITDSYPELKGKEKEFRIFALKPTHKGVNLDVLARAFLYGAPEAPREPKKGSLIERGSGGPKTPQKPKKGYTSEELSLLRKTDYKKWKEVVEKGQIEEEV